MDHIDVIAERWVSGETARSIAQDYGVSHQAISSALPTHKDFPELVRRRATLRLEQLGRRLDAESDRYRVTVAPSKGVERTYTDEELDRWLVRVARGFKGVLSQQSWEKVRSGRSLKGEMPSASLYTKRFGSWNAAKRRVGLPVTTDRVGRYNRRFSAEDCEAAVLEFMRETLAVRGRKTFRDFEAWCRERAGTRPSAILVRNRLNGWTDAAQDALNKLEKERQTSV